MKRGGQTNQVAGPRFLFNTKINDMADLVTRLLLNNTNFNNNIQASTKELMAFRRQAETVSSGLSAVTGTLGKMAGAFGVAMGAGEIFGKMLQQNQTFGDNFRRAQQQASEAVNFFAVSLAQADFSNFLNGLQSVIAKAGQAADSLDELQSRTLLFGRSNKKDVTEYNKLMNIARDPMATVKQREKALKKAQELDKKMAVQEKSLSKANKKAAADQIDKELAKYGVSVNNQQRDWLFNYGNFDKRKGYANEYRNALKERDRLLAQADKSRRERERKEAQNRVGGVTRRMGYNKEEQELINRANSYNKVLNKAINKMSYAADEINDGANSALATAISAFNAADDLEQRTSDRQYQMDRAHNRVLKTGTPHKVGKVGKVTTVTPQQPEAPVGSMAYYDKKIGELQQQLKLAVDPESMAEIQKQIEDFKGKNRTMEIQVQFLMDWNSGKLTQGAKIVDSKLMEQQISDDLKKLSASVASQMEKVSFAMQQPMVEAVRKMKSFEMKVVEPYKKFTENAGNIVNGIEGIDGMVYSFNNLVTSIENGANAWDIFMGVIQTATSIMNGVTTVMETANAIMKLAGATAAETATKQAAASSTVIAAKSGEAIAGATAGGAMMPFPYSLIAIAAGIAAVVAALSMIGGFATGGTVGGNSFTGDKLLARVNSGERILPAKKAAELDDFLENVGTGSGGGMVDFQIRGDRLYGVLRNYTATKSHTCKVTRF